MVDDEDYYIYLVTYIHRNPIHHRIVSNFSDWEYSSYNQYISDDPTILEINKNEVLAYFYSLDDFIQFHIESKIKPGTENYLLE